MWSASTFAVLPFVLHVATGSAISTELVTRQAQTQAAEVPVLSDCSTKCLAQALPASGCSPNDGACLCTSLPFANAVTVCLTANCTVSESLVTRKYSAVTCQEPVRNNGGITKALTWLFFSIATFGIIARLLSRLPALKGTGYSWDDYTIVLSWALLVPSDAILHHMVDIGLGQDIWMVEPFSHLTGILYWFYISEFTYVILLSTTKIAILLLYLRMWPSTGAIDEPRWFRRSCLTLIAILVAYAAILIIVLGLQCQPISFSWTKWDGEHPGTCINTNELIYATSALNIFFDMLTILLPIPRLLSLSIATRKKFAVLATFLIGLFVTFCSIIRLRSLAVFGSAPNFTWLYNPIAIWSNLEINLGVLCACIPAIAGLMQRCYTMVTGRGFTSAAGYGQRSMNTTRGSQYGMEKVEEHHYELSANTNSKTAQAVSAISEPPPPRRHGNGAVQYYGPTGVQASQHVTERNGSVAKTITSSVSTDEHDEIYDERPSPVEPTTFPKSEAQASQQMIDAGYSAFSHLKGSR